MTPSVPNGAPDPDPYTFADKVWLAVLLLGIAASAVACVRVWP